MRIRNTFKLGEFGSALFHFGSAQLVSNILRIFAGFIVVRLLEPKLYGEFTGVGVYMGYVLLGHGGVLNGLSREMPYEFGKKNDQYAKELASSAFSLSVILSSLTIIGFLVIGLYQLSLDKILIGVIYLSYSIIGGLRLLNTQFLPRLYFRNKDFNNLSKQNLKIGIGNFLTVILVYFWGIYGLIFRTIIVATYQFALLFHNKPFKLQFIYKIKHLKKLFKTGFPIFFVGQINPLWTTVLNNIVFLVGGPQNMGLYALSLIVQNGLNIIPSAFSSVIYPRMTMMLSEGVETKLILKKNFLPMVFQFVITLFIVSIAVLILPPLIRHFLPKYSDGIKAAQWMLFVPLVESFNAFNNIYNVIKKQFWFFVSLAFGALIGSFFVYYQLHFKGFSLEIFPQGLLIGTAIQQLLSLWFIKLMVQYNKWES